METRRRSEGEDEFFAEIRYLIIIAVFAMFAILSIAFRSYFLPIIILSALPFGFGGAVLGHIIFGKGLSMISYWGIGAACGVVVNDNLVLVDNINRLKSSGKHILECIVGQALLDLDQLSSLQLLLLLALCQ